MGEQFAQFPPALAALPSLAELDMEVCTIGWGGVGWGWDSTVAHNRVTNW